MEYLIFSGAVVLLILLVFITGRVREKKNKKWFMDKLEKSYGQVSDYKLNYDELNHIRRYFEKHPENGQVDDITYNDLNMDLLFEQLNFAKSSCGEEYLYYRMRTPYYEEEPLRAFEEKVMYFMREKEKRTEAQYAFSRMGKLGKYSLYDYLDHLENLEINNLPLILWDLALIPAVVLMFVSVPYGLVCLLFVLTHNIFTYFKKRTKIEPYITSFAYIFKMLSVLDDMRSVFCDSPCAEEAQVMKACSDAMRGFRRGSFIVMNGRGGLGASNPLDALFDYLCMIFSFDLLKFNHMLSCVRQKKDMIEKCLTVIGYLETVISVGMYRASLENGYCEPVFAEEYRAEQMYHPLLKAPVKNSLHTDGNVLLTGSNASGKSTFLKTIAVNAILAQTIHTCTASEYAAPFYRVLSSMNLSDSVETGDSYYVAEIKSIRRMFDALHGQKDQDVKIFCFLDEVLRGTNTVERIAAATQILQALSDSGVRCLAATHDIELTELLAESYEMYHFEETVEQDDIQFSYELLQGKATTRNAIRLLQLMGFEEALIEKAEARAELFMKTGNWCT